MIPQISSALSKGFTSKQIIDFLIKKFPEHADKIKTALASGYTVDQVLKYLGGGRKALNQDLQPQTEYEKTRGTDIQRRETANKSALAIGSLPATALASQAAGAALSRAVPHALQSLIPGIQNAIAPSMTNQSMQPSQQPQVPSLIGLQPTTLSQQPPVSSNITQPQPVAQPQGIVNPREYLEKLGIKDKVDNLLKAGNSPEQAAAALGIKRSGEAKIDPELLANIDAYSKEKLRDEAMQPEGSLPIAKKEEQKTPIIENLKVGDEFETHRGEKATLTKLDNKTFEYTTDKGGKRSGPIESLKYELERGKPIVKNETVMSPHGVAEVKEIRNGKALIEIDGKKYQVNEDELEASPLPEKELDDLYDDLIKGIESETGEDVSRMVQWAGYNPETNTLQFLPHTGKLYKYSNISPEDAALLRDILSVRKTSGENFIGAWKAGSKSPIGAALSKLIRRLQSERGGKGNEYEETHEPIYSAYEPAIQAKKKKKKK